MAALPGSDRAFVELQLTTEVYGVWLIVQKACPCGECALSDVMITLLRDEGEDWQAVVRVAVRRGDRVEKTGSVARKRGATREQAINVTVAIVEELRDMLGPDALVEHTRIDATGTEAMDRFLRWARAAPRQNAPGGLS